MPILFLWAAGIFLSEREIKFGMQAVKWVVVKLQGDKNCRFLLENEWSRSFRKISQHPSLPWHFTTHGFLVCICFVFIRNPEKGAFARGALRKFAAQLRAKFAQNCRFFVSSQICREFDSQFRTILCKYPFSNAPF